MHSCQGAAISTSTAKAACIPLCIWKTCKTYVEQQSLPLDTILITSCITQYKQDTLINAPKAQRSGQHQVVATSPRGRSPAGLLPSPRVGARYLWGQSAVSSTALCTTCSGGHAAPPAPPHPAPPAPPARSRPRSPAAPHPAGQ